MVKLVRAIRKGWLKVNKEAEDEQEPKPYLLWAEDGQGSARTAAGLAYIPAPRPTLPGHAESYNPPREYLPTEARKRDGVLQDGGCCGSGVQALPGTDWHDRPAASSCPARPRGATAPGAGVHALALHPSFALPLSPLPTSHTPLLPSPRQEELAAIEAASDDEKPEYVPQAFNSLRAVPAYASFIKERFERCLDLYLCPRGRRKRLLIKGAEGPALPGP